MKNNKDQYQYENNGMCNNCDKKEKTYHLEFVYNLTHSCEVIKYNVDNQEIWLCEKCLKLYINFIKQFNLLLIIPNLAHAGGWPQNFES